MRYALILVLAFSSCFGAAGFAQGQQSSIESGHKVVRKVEPVYPQVAKRLNLGGTVKVLAVVAPDGSVKKVEPVGGSPVLVQAAESAVAKWKYVPGTESKT